MHTTTKPRRPWGAGTNPQPTRFAMSYWVTERDELANVIAETYLNNMASGPLAQKLTNTDLAEDILAAGYRRPRQVTTVEELDALPVESIVRDATGFTWDKWWDEDGSEFSWWATTGDRTEYSPKRVNLPATVLHVGGAE